MCRLLPNAIEWYFWHTSRLYVVRWCAPRLSRSRLLCTLSLARALSLSLFLSLSLVLSLSISLSLWLDCPAHACFVRLIESNAVQCHMIWSGDIYASNPSIPKAQQRQAISLLLPALALLLLYYCQLSYCFTPALLLLDKYLIQPLDC